MKGECKGRGRHRRHGGKGRVRFPAGGKQIRVRARVRARVRKEVRAKDT